MIGVCPLPLPSTIATVIMIEMEAIVEIIIIAETAIIIEEEVEIITEITMKTIEIADTLPLNNNTVKVLNNHHQVFLPLLNNSNNNNSILSLYHLMPKVSPTRINSKIRTIIICKNLLNHSNKINNNSSRTLNNSSNKLSNHPLCSSHLP